MHKLRLAIYEYVDSAGGQRDATIAACAEHADVRAGALCRVDFHRAICGVSCAQGQVSSDDFLYWLDAERGLQFGSSASVAV